MAIVSSLAVDLTLRSAQFTRGLQASQRSLIGFGTVTATVSRSLRSLATMGGLLGTGGILAGFTKLITSGIQWADTLDDMSKRIGIAHDALAALQLISAKAGIGFDSLVASIQRMQVTISKAAGKPGAENTLLQSLGIDPSNLRTGTTIQQFNVIIAALGRIRNEADRIRATREIFGRGGGILSGLIAEGSGPIAKAAADVVKFGTALDAIDAKRASKIADAWIDVKEAFKGLGFEISNLIGLQAFLDTTSNFIGQRAGILRDWRKSDEEQARLGLDRPDTGPKSPIPSFSDAEWKRITTDTQRPSIAMEMRNLKSKNLQYPLATRMWMMRQAMKAAEVVPQFETPKINRERRTFGSFQARFATEIGAPGFGGGPASFPMLSRSGKLEERQLQVQEKMLDKLRSIEQQNRNDAVTDD